MERKTRDLTDEVRSLKSQNDELNRKQRDLTSENDNLNRTCQDLERDNRKLQMEIDRLTMQLKVGQPLCFDPIVESSDQLVMLFLLLMMIDK